MAAFGDPPPVLTDPPYATTVLRVGERDVAEYVWRPDLPLSSSPRPYLHPVRTLGGRTVTDALPDTHRHQLGISIAAPNVDGCNFWGGRTWVAGHGPAWLDNHGTQRHHRWLRHTSTDLAHAVRWIGPHDTTLLREHRSITCRGLGETAWSLSIRTELTNATGRPLTLRSPAGQGRAGAGYGGFFWRGPAVVDTARILSPAGTEVQSVHGAVASWVAVTGDGGSGAWTVLFVAADEATAADRWFVRSRDYLGVGSSITWDRPLVLAPEQTIARQIVAVVLDGVVSPETAADLAGSVRSTP